MLELLYNVALMFAKLFHSTQFNVMLYNSNQFNSFSAVNACKNMYFCAL